MESSIDLKSDNSNGKLSGSGQFTVHTDALTSSLGVDYSKDHQVTFKLNSEGNIKITPDSNLKISGGLSYNPQNNELSGLSSLEFTVPSKVALTLEQQIKKDGSNVGLHLKFNL